MYTLCIYIYIYIYTHTHCIHIYIYTVYIHIYIYIYIYIGGACGGTRFSGARLFGAEVAPNCLTKSSTQTVIHLHSCNHYICYYHKTNYM